MNENPLPQGLFVKNEDRKGNKAIFSQLMNFQKEEKNNPFLSIKYVMDGTENYMLNRTSFKVNKGEYLLINRGQSYQGYFSSNKPVKGMCFYLDQAIMNDVFNNLRQEHSNLLDDPGGTKNYRLFDIYEDVYNKYDNPLGLFLASVCERMGAKHEPDVLLDDEIYYPLAGKLLQTQGIVFKAMSDINAEKFTTRRELYRRVYQGKKILEECYDQNIEMDDIAEQAALSKFHFFRIFKQAFGISPYQYLLRFRLHRALAQLKKGNHSISEIAYANGFTDIYSFSKCFKKKYHSSPSHYMAENSTK